MVATGITLVIGIMIAIGIMLVVDRKKRYNGVN